MIQDNTSWVRRRRSRNWFLWLVLLLVTILLAFAIYFYTKHTKDADTRPSVETVGGEMVSGRGVLEVNDSGIVATESGITPNKAVATLVIYNGTSKIGITLKYANALASRPDVEVLDKQNASKRDYPRTFVVSVSGKALKTAKELAFLLDAPVVEIMPDGESTPSADILVILGENYRK